MIKFTGIFRPWRSRRRAGHPDYLIIFCLIAILLFGLLILASASSNLAINRYQDAFFFIKRQLLQGFLIGGLFFFLAYFLNYQFLKKLSLPLFILSLILLVLIFTNLGETRGGATRWLNFGFFELQPSEIVKFTFIIYLASWLSGHAGARRQKTISEGFLPFLSIITIVSLLLLWQPSTSVIAILISAALITYFMSGGRLSLLGGLFLASLVLISVFIVFTPYRLERVNTFINSLSGRELETRDSAYHLNQALITIGAGGWFGVGYGNSVTKIKYLPEPIGDSIFAVIAEEFGFIGATLTVLLFLTFIIRSLIIANRLDDAFARLTIIGFASIIGLQSFIHIGSISGVIPMTGVPLPFISFGSTAMVVFLAMSGVILNFSRYAR